MKPKPRSEFSKFAVELCRAHARDIMNEPPFITVVPPVRSDVDDEFFTEGRQPRIGHRPDPKGET